MGKKLEYIPPVYGPTKETVTQLIALALNLGFSTANVRNNVSTIFGFLDSLCEAPRENINPLALPEKNPRIFQTQSHIDLLTILKDGVLSLSTGEYVETNGSAWTLVGAKGIGKTTTLQSFTDVCSVLFPDVVSVYVSFNEFNVTNGPLTTSTLLEAVWQNLIDRGFLPKPARQTLMATVCNAFWQYLRDLGFIPQTRKISFHELLVNALRTANLRLLILVDEIDQLYRVPHDGEIGKLCVKSLNDLSFLGNQTSGRFLTYICGSSSAIPLLVTRNLPDGMLNEFPLIKAAPNLNGTKFSTQRVYSSPPTDLNVVKIIINQPNCSIEFQRVVAFTSGATARSIQKIIKQGVNARMLESLSADETLQGLNTLSSPVYGPFLRKLLEKLQIKNKIIVDKLLTGGGIDFGSVGNLDWEKKFQPLTFVEAQEAYGSMQKESDEPIENSRVYNSLLHLHDRSWIVICRIENGLPSEIYPCSLIQVLKLNLDGPRMEAARKTIAEYIEKSVSSISLTSAAKVATDVVRASTGVIAVI
jgi:hypothetical protein